MLTYYGNVIGPPLTAIYIRDFTQYCDIFTRFHVMLPYFYAISRDGALFIYAVMPFIYAKIS